MEIIPAELLKSALALPEQERLLLATELIDSIAGSPRGLSIDDPGFFAEIDRRVSDGSTPIPWEEVKLRLDKSLIQ